MPDFIKIAKFGGTSLADASAMKRCASIIKSDSDKRVIVVSATSGTTNLLTAITQSSDPEERRAFFRQIELKHLDILREMPSSDELDKSVSGLLNELQSSIDQIEQFDARLADHLLSFGERLSSTIFTHLLNVSSIDAELVDARKIIRTDSHFGDAEPDTAEISKLAAEGMAEQMKSARLVTQGFIGADINGETTTLGRGGSDYSAALFAEALDADVLEIWTDVSAIYSTDPRVVEDAVPITEITFDEAAELSVFGAKVLHPATLKPALRKNVRVYVGSSMDPEKPGTWIVRNTSDLPVIRAISLRREQTLLTVHSLDMLHRHGFLARLFQILSDYKISVDLVTTSEVSVSLTLDTDRKGVRPRLTPEMLEELKSFADVRVEKDLSLIALVGNNLDATAGVSGPLFKLLDDINIRLICHGASSHNLCFLVKDSESTNVIRKLHSHFITKKDEAITS